MVYFFSYAGTHPRWQQHHRGHVRHADMGNLITSEPPRSIKESTRRMRPPCGCGQARWWFRHEKPCLSWRHHQGNPGLVSCRSALRIPRSHGQLHHSRLQCPDWTCLIVNIIKIQRDPIVWTEPSAREVSHYFVCQFYINFFLFQSHQSDFLPKKRCVQYWCLLNVLCSSTS